jgi:hypothetical protein
MTFWFIGLLVYWFIGLLVYWFYFNKHNQNFYVTIFLNKLSCGEDVGKQKRQPTDKQLIAFYLSDLAGVRTLDPLLKREMLYQLSYQVFYEAANIKFSFVSTSCFFLFFLSFSILLLYYILASFVV